MCKPQSEGGQRCAAHTRGAEKAAFAAMTVALADQKIEGADLEKVMGAWNAAAIAYASTPEGQTVFQRRADASAESGTPVSMWLASTFQNVMLQGNLVRQRNKEIGERLRADRDAKAMAATVGATETASGQGYTLTDLGEVTLGRSTFRVERQDYTDSARHMTWLHGSRGAVYFLRGYMERGGDTGLRQVISWKSGAPLRQQGNEIRVLEFGTHIEPYVARPQPIH
jgi:hypothetical protein